MDSEHRHELKTNELADWISHAPRFFRENVKTITAVVLLVAAVIVVKVGFSMKSQAQMARSVELTALIGRAEGDKLVSLRNPDDLASGEALSDSADRLAESGQASGNPSVAALALIKSGNARRAQLHYSPSELGPEEIAKAIGSAREAYEEALTKAEAAVNKSELKAMAKMGLGLCAEELGDIEQAKGIYNEIMAEESFAGTVFPAQARLRLETMEDSQGNFTFVEAPEPEVVEDPAATDVSGSGAAESIEAAPVETIEPATSTTDESGEESPGTTGDSE